MNKDETFKLIYPTNSQVFICCSRENHKKIESLSLLSYYFSLNIILETIQIEFSQSELLQFLQLKYSSPGIVRNFQLPQNRIKLNFSLRVDEKREKKTNFYFID